MKSEVIIYILDTRTGEKRKLDHLNYVYLDGEGNLKGIQDYLKVLYEITIVEEDEVY